MKSIEIFSGLNLEKYKILILIRPCMEKKCQRIKCAPFTNNIVYNISAIYKKKLQRYV